MDTSAKSRSPGHWLRWLDVRRRQPGMYAFVLNRVTAIGLTVYLFIHLYTLRLLAQGPQAYDQFLATVKSPAFVFGELLVVIGGLYHGLNGIRVALTGLGIAVPRQRELFWVLFTLAAIGSLVFAVRMFTA